MKIFASSNFSQNNSHVLRWSIIDKKDVIFSQRYIFLIVVCRIYSILSYIYPTTIVDLLKENLSNNHFFFICFSFVSLSDTLNCAYIHHQNKLRSVQWKGNRNNNKNEGRDIRCAFSLSYWTITHIHCVLTFASRFCPFFLQFYESYKFNT